ncbi:MAG TPA: LuxR C-terminal-related transcriptional regulator [Pyrinomonadaceae bacterium]|nr:LuxR C-terminal-related transcriptional regulator [Pyrinomonadaceae bacterium]
MRLEEIKGLTESTSDPAFAVDAQGLIVAWNRAAEGLLALPATEAIGRTCGEIIQGADECGQVCSEDCTIRQALLKRHPINNFDMQVGPAGGKQWCNVSVLIADNNGHGSPFAVYIMRPIDLRKRLEILVRDFVVSNTNVPPQEAVALLSSGRTAATDATLTTRELEILRMLAHGSSSKSIGEQLHISLTTVNNHVQHILRKLDAHTRLQAIRRAERGGLI